MNVKDLLESMKQSFILCWQSSIQTFLVRIFIQVFVSTVPLVHILLSKLIIDQIIADYQSNSFIIDNHLVNMSLLFFQVY